LDPREIFNLYQLRKIVEVGAIRVAVEHASDEGIAALERFLVETGPDDGGRSLDQLVALDEDFHERLIALSGNEEIVQVLRNVNGRIQFVRWVDMDRVSRPVTQAEHRSIVERLRARDIAACAAALERHIDRRRDQITSAISAGLTQIYVTRRGFADASP
jgi:DNA-binding GntR family transcriptional regulator